MCEFVDTCDARNEYVVNGRIRVAQTQACGAHLGAAVAYMAKFNDTRYGRQSPDYGVRVYPTGS
jgi:hypothetical protein